MQTPQVSAKAIQPPWIGIFPVRTPVVSSTTTHRQQQQPQPPSPPLPDPLLAGSQSSQLLFAENDHQTPTHTSTVMPTLSPNHPRPMLYVVMQEVTMVDVVVDGKSERVKAEKDGPNNNNSNNTQVLDRQFDISLLKLDHISFADKATTSKSKAKKGASEEEESPCDIVSRILERSRKRESGVANGANDDVKNNADDDEDAFDMLMPITVVWKGRTSLSKMCPIDIQQALNATNNNTNSNTTTSSSSSSPSAQLSYLRAYGSLVEEILMNRSSNNNKDASTTNTTTSKSVSKSAKAEPFAATVAQKVVAETQSLVAQQRHACKSVQTTSTSNNSNAGGAVVDTLFHLKAEEVEDGDGDAHNLHGDDNTTTTTSIGGEVDGFLGFLRSHGITAPITTGAQSPHIDPLTTLLKHAYGLVRNASSSRATTATTNNTMVKQLSDQDNTNKATTIKRSDSGGGGSFTGGGGGDGATIDQAVLAMRRHRYMFLKKNLGLMGGVGDSNRGNDDDATRPTLLFTVSPEEVLHAPLSHQQACGLPMSTMLPSVVTLEVRMATMSDSRGGDVSRGGGPSFVGDGPRSYLPFANVHCFLDPSHRNQIDPKSSSSSSSSSSKPSSAPPLIVRHPLGGFLNMLCGSFLHHNQLSEEVLPALLATQHALISTCFLPLASTTLTREAELFATFETILNAKKAKIREVAEDGLRAQRRADDMEALVVRLQERNNMLEQQLRNGGVRQNANDDNDNDDGESSQRHSDEDDQGEEVLEVAPDQLLLAQPVTTTMGSPGISQQQGGGSRQGSRQLQGVVRSPSSASGDVQGGGVGLLLAATSPPPAATRKQPSVPSPSSPTPKIVKGEKRVRDVTDDDWIPNEYHTHATTTTVPPTTTNPPAVQEDDDLLSLLN